MEFRTFAPIPARDSEGMAFYVKCLIEGHAKGCAPLLRKWKLPPLMRSGVKFAYEPGHGSGVEDFALPLTVYTRGWGDCDDLCIWKIAEELAAGRKASCRTSWLNGGMHVQVRLKNGKIFDPAILLGAPSSWPKKLLWDL